MLRDKLVEILSLPPAEIEAALEKLAIEEGTTVGILRAQLWEAAEEALNPKEEE
ncbi:MAG: hypothetical protein HY577_00120 [Candidatus Nealsonbacteria bacterium]|nr:hypothetical protein [Candidatus Nealsonbacteria bacterium]